MRDTPSIYVKSYASGCILEVTVSCKRSIMVDWRASSTVFKRIFTQLKTDVLWISTLGQHAASHHVAGTDCFGAISMCVGLSASSRRRCPKFSWRDSDCLLETLSLAHCWKWSLSLRACLANVSPVPSQVHPRHHWRRFSPSSKTKLDISSGMSSNQ